MSNFARAVDLVLQHEGGLSTDPRDHGGTTNYGISQRSYPAINIAALTRQQAADIYQRDYWAAVRGDELPYGLAVQVFDHAVNAGTIGAIKLLQRTLAVDDDGILGPITLSRAAASGRAAILGYARRRIRYYAGLTQWPLYGDSWTQRTLDTLIEAVTPMSAALIEANVATVRAALATWAPFMAARYNAPVYLVGSTLHSPTPRDCDIRIVMDDDAFAARYGAPRVQQEFGESHPMRKHRGLVAARVVDWDNWPPSQPWIDDFAKFNHALSKRLERIMDIQGWPESHWYPPYPEAIVLAAPSRRLWFYSAHCVEPTP